MADASEGSESGTTSEPKLDMTFEDLREYGLVGSVCSVEYGSFFALAVGIIADACENYTPPG